MKGAMLFAGLTAIACALPATVQELSDAETSLRETIKAFARFVEQQPNAPEDILPHAREVSQSSVHEMDVQADGGLKAMKMVDWVSKTFPTDMLEKAGLWLDISQIDLIEGKSYDEDELPTELVKLGPKARAFEELKAKVESLGYNEVSLYSPEYSDLDHYSHKFANRKIEYCFDGSWVNDVLKNGRMATTAATSRALIRTPSPLASR